jgi:hypothetical protein
MLRFKSWSETFFFKHYSTVSILLQAPFPDYLEYRMRVTAYRFFDLEYVKEIVFRYQQEQRYLVWFKTKEANFKYIDYYLPLSSLSPTSKIFRCYKVERFLCMTRNVNFDVDCLEQRVGLKDTGRDLIPNYVVIFSTNMLLYD